MAGRWVGGGLSGGRWIAEDGSRSAVMIAAWSSSWLELWGCDESGKALPRAVSNSKPQADGTAANQKGVFERCAANGLSRGCWREGAGVSLMAKMLWRTFLGVDSAFLKSRLCLPLGFTHPAASIERTGISQSTYPPKPPPKLNGGHRAVSRLTI